MDGRDGDGAVSKGEGWELRLGRWQDVLADVEWRCADYGPAVQRADA